jgi:hypothetical protein
MLPPYSSNLAGSPHPAGVAVAQEAVFGQPSGSPPTSTVASMFILKRPVVSMVIEDVPWPELIVPAEVVQL